MSFTIRARLTIWYALAFSAVILVVLGVLALELKRQLDKEITTALRTEEHWIETLFEHEFLPLLTAPEKEYGELAAELYEELEERYGLQRQFAIIAIEKNGQPIVFNGGLKNAQELLPHDFLGRRAGNYNVLLDEHRYRVRVFRRLWGAVAVGVENETVFRVAKEAGEILVWIVPFALIFAAAGGWLLAKLAMRPVLAAAKAAEAISVTNLKNRLPVYAGKDEFGKLVATLNHMIARLQDGVNRLQQFTQDAAHELRTPLTILRGDLELAYQNENTAEETRVFLQRTLDRVIALGQIVDNLMLLARSDSGDYPIHKAPFRLDLAVKEIYEDLQILAEGRPLAVQLQNGETVEFFGDESLVRRLLLNLCDNALKYTSQGNIDLSLKKVDTTIELVISDTGEGIPAEDLPHIFDRFYRADKSRSSGAAGASSGLGLAICKWIASAHGGDIAITSTAGAGTTVHVSLPCHS